MFGTRQPLEPRINRRDARRITLHRARVAVLKQPHLRACPWQTDQAGSLSPPRRALIGRSFARGSASRRQDRTAAAAGTWDGGQLALWNGTLYTLFDCLAEGAAARAQSLLFVQRFHGIGFGPDRGGRHPHRSAVDRRGATRHERPADGGTSKKSATRSQDAIHDGLFPKRHRPPRSARSWRCDDPKADHTRRSRGTDTRLTRCQSPRSDDRD